jgi:Flp pilus assembly secretin CpaC
MRRLLIACLAAAALSTPALAAPQTSVALDHTTRINLRSPAGSVVVGNPAVADVTVVDSQTLFLQGKGYGVTEVVVLDPLGRTIWQGEVVVTAPTQGAVSVYRGAQVTEMACAQSCATSVRSAPQDDRPAQPSTTTP